MAYSHTLDLVQGDTNPQLTMTLRDANQAAPGTVLDAEDSSTWAVIDLTGGEVRLKLREQGSADIRDTLTGTITDAANGVAVFLFGPTTLDLIGTLEGEIEFEDDGGRVQTVYELIRIRVRAEF